MVSHVGRESAAAWTAWTRDVGADGNNPSRDDVLAGWSLRHGWLSYLRRGAGRLRYQLTGSEHIESRRKPEPYAHVAFEAVHDCRTQ